MRVYDLIAKKRDGGTHSREDKPIAIYLSSFSVFFVTTL